MPAERWRMTKDQDQKIVRDERGEEQPKDKERAQTAHTTEHAPEKEQGSTPGKKRRA
jgi:hypothetical protein